MLALRRSWWLSLSVAALIACSKPEPPTVTPQSARVTRVDPLGLTLAVTVEVHNPNSFPLVVQSVDGTLALATGTPLGSGRAALQSSIPANGSSSVAGELGIPWANLAALAPYALSPADVPYSFRGTGAARQRAPERRRSVRGPRRALAGAGAGARFARSEGRPVGAPRGVSTPPSGFTRQTARPKSEGAPRRSLGLSIDVIYERKRQCSKRS